MNNSPRVGFWSWTTLGAGVLFLYLPIFILMFYSFNESRLVTVWAGFSTKWYYELFSDDQMMKAVGMSLKIAFLSATSAVVLGTMAAMVMVPSCASQSVGSVAVTSSIMGSGGSLRVMLVPCTGQVPLSLRIHTS